MKFEEPTIARQSARVFRYGLMAAQTAMPLCRTISEATKPIRRMFVSRSSA
jgi:hypothetical protein